MHLFGSFIELFFRMSAPSSCNFYTLYRVSQNKGINKNFSFGLFVTLIYSVLNFLRFSGSVRFV